MHDLKNQLNGLKLYATFLRKRLEKAERPADELETIAKLIAGLERAANDTAVMVRYGRPLELRRSQRVDLSGILAAAVNSPVRADAGTYEGTFDVAAASEAFQSIMTGARTNKAGENVNGIEISLRRDNSGNSPFAVVEWHGVSVEEDENLFQSFAGSNGLRMALAAKIIRMHGGDVAHDASVLRVRLPLDEAEVRG
ncbi:MAG TPA: hypothetical protein VM943_03035 [Pyrinomonadaceae bacterium]|nr:hypothetical protein [Pyrinomonadaceae bacterium]